MMNFDSSHGPKAPYDSYHYIFQVQNILIYLICFINWFTQAEMPSHNILNAVGIF